MPLHEKWNKVASFNTNNTKYIGHKKIECNPKLCQYMYNNGKVQHGVRRGLLLHIVVFHCI